MSKKRLFTLLVTASLLSAGSKAAFADTTNNTNNTDATAANTEQMIEKMSQQTSALEAQMKTLESQIHELKVQQLQMQQAQSRTRAKARTTKAKTQSKSQTQSQTQAQSKSQYQCSSETQTQTQTQAQSQTQQKTTTNGSTGSTSNTASGLPVVPNSQGTISTLHPPVTPGGQLSEQTLSGVPVTIAPYVGQHTAFNASDLVVNYSFYNEDLRLLQLRQSICKECLAGGENADLTPQLMLSGKVEGQVIYQKPYLGTHTSRIDLTGAELDVIPTLGQWANGFIAFRYDNSQIQNTPLTSNSRVFVDRGFLTLGDLDVFPMYVTLGQMYVPFGAYSTTMLTDPLTEDLFQIRDRAFLLGYQGASGQGPYAAIYGFNGDSNTNHNNNINNFGANIGYGYTADNWNTDFGVGAITNVADALGMQQTNANLVNSFNGFSIPTPQDTMPEVLKRQVPGIAPRLTLGIGSFSITGEYITATSPFAFQNLTFDGAPAKPRALNVEGSYSFHVFDKPSSITLGYGDSWQALAFNVPTRRYIAAFTTSIWRSTVQELEFRHDQNYQFGTTASGNLAAIPAIATGGSSNTVTLQLGVYF